MTSPRSLPHAGGLARIDPGTGAVDRIITLQYAAEKRLRRSLEAQAIADEPDRFGGAAAEWAAAISLDAELDATDQLEVPRKTRMRWRRGFFPRSRRSRRTRT